MVKVFSTVRYPDLYKPWLKQAPTELSGSGVVIEGRRILSNAHLVLYASQVQIQGDQAGDKLTATVEAMAPGIDLAVLKLDDGTFFDSHPPLPRAKVMPDVQDPVLVYGFPTGGSSISVTKGIVSRIEFAPYSYSVGGLRIQIDAAVNHGNGGGPAVAGGKMIGLAFSFLGGTQNIGYIIPCEEIELFLQSIADGHYHGKPVLLDQCQTLENAALRSFLNVDPATRGIVVHRPYSDEPEYPLKQWDVITAIGDSPVDDQGLVKGEGNLRVFFKYMVQKVARNGKVPLTVWRKGKEIHVEVPVRSDRHMLIPALESAYPDFFICGPLVFSSATADYLVGFAKGTYGGTMMATLVESGTPMLNRYGEEPAFEGERLVLVSSPFFPNKLTKGYSNPSSSVVKTVNSIHVKNLRHLVEILRDSKEKYITIEFGNRGGETLVFPRTELMAATDDILADNGIRLQGSPDILSVWNAKPTDKDAQNGKSGH